MFFDDVSGQNAISEVTRRAIADHLNLSKISWSGRYGDDGFLSRLYDLASLPSHDGRYSTAAGDIYQHMVRNRDWESDWVFTDLRFKLLWVSDEEFLRFLCETVHPVVRSSEEEALELVTVYNAALAADGWQLVEGKRISGRPVYVAQSAQRVSIFQEPTGWQKVDRQMQELKERLDVAHTEEQCQAVGLLCREILISVALEVYSAARHPQIDGVAPSQTDAKRMLEAIFDIELRGSTNDQARAHAKAAVNLALALQHKRTAEFRTAALCAEGTVSVVNMLAIVAGRRRQL